MDISGNGTCHDVIIGGAYIYRSTPPSLPFDKAKKTQGYYIICCTNLRRIVMGLTQMIETIQCVYMKHVFQSSFEKSTHLNIVKALTDIRMS